MSIMRSVEELLALMVKTFRRERLQVQQSERTTIHGADCMLMVLQLAMAEVNKRQRGEFTVTLSDILMAWKHLILHKLNLPPASSVPLESYNLILEEYNSFLKHSNTVDLLDIYTMYKDLKVEGSLTPTQLLEFLSGNTKSAEAENPSVPSTPSSTPRCSSQIKTAVRRVFCSYLSLLVNSKNDLAMAQTLDVPKRSLGRDAFTSIKHASRDDETPLFLAVISFVRAIQLGGKGYAPAESHPLRKHVKGLSDFVQVIDNLEEILGEIPDPSACCTRLVMAIRALLVKGRSSGDPVYIAADTTAKELKEQLFQLHQSHKLAPNESMTGISPARPKAYAINHATALGGRDSVKLLMALLDEEALNTPCPNKAELLSEDQPILDGEEGICVLTLYRSPEVSTGCSPLSLTDRVQSRLELLEPKVQDKKIRSQFACTYNDDELPLNRVLDFPSASQVPTCVHPAPKPRWMSEEECFPSVDADNSASESSNTETRSLQQRAALGPRTGNAHNSVARPGKRKKTGIDVQIKANKRKQVETDQPGGSENEPPKKKPPTTGKNPGKAISKTTNKKLIAGQGKLTTFFRL
ncbi:PCNA-interacting partner [Eucyclogobius newberryi]|uniref:PCNA-interacting partner n=1 Tax=Eucyclogobius newberryi TaxID=166745 RepID=UPI003B5CDDC9